MSTKSKTSVATTLSWTLPPVKNSLTGLPIPSTRACIFVFFPPRETPISWFVSAPKAPFLRHRRVDVPWRLCYLMINLAYLRLWPMRQRFFQSRLRQTIAQICHIVYSMNHSVRANLATALRCALSKGFHLTLFGYPLTVCPVLLFALAVRNLSPVPIRCRLLRSVFPCLPFYSPLLYLTTFWAFCHYRTHSSLKIWA